MNLYELNQMYSEALDGAIDENGEILDDRLTELLDEISEVKEERILYLVKKLESREYEIEAIAKKIKSMKARHDSLVKSAASLEKYIRQNTKPTDVFKDDETEFSYAKGKPSVAVSREKDKLRLKRLRAVYPDYIKENLVYAPDKDALKKAIENGERFVGIRLQSTPRMVIK